MIKKIVPWLVALGLSLPVQAEEESCRRFEGTIGENLPITLLLNTELNEDGSNHYSGSYHYHKTGIPIPLERLMKRSDTLRFLENRDFDADGNPTSTGQWAVTLTEDSIAGTWMSQDGKRKLPIQLKESYPVGSIKTKSTQVEHKNNLRLNGRSVGFETELSYLQLQAETAAAKKINNELRRSACNLSGDEKDVPANPTDKDILKAVLKRGEGDLPESMSDTDILYVDSLQDSQKVIMNDNGFLTVEYLTWHYSGGAHGNGAMIYRTYDLKTGAEVDLKSLVNPGHEKHWAELGAAELRMQQRLKPNAPLTEAGLFEDKLQLNDNWFLTPGGIGFLYNAYEIASYARGAVTFVLPWKDILPDLKPGTPVHKMASEIVEKTKK